MLLKRTRLGVRMPVRDRIEPGHVPPSAYATFVEESGGCAVVFLDPEGRIASWSASAERLHGYSADEIVGKPHDTLYPDGDIGREQPAYPLRVSAKAGYFTEDAWRRKKDGTAFWANITLSPLRDEQGSVAGFVQVTVDLTGRKQTEDALRASEERFRLLTRSVRDYAIFMLDPRGYIVSWNEGARRLNGYEDNEIIGEHFSRFYPREEIERDHPAHELAIAMKEGRYEEEGWRVRKDGTLFWASVTITTLRDATGTHVGFAKVTRDLTARKRAEEELRERAQSYARLNRELDAFSHAVAHDLRSPIRAIEHLASVLIEEEGARLTPDGLETLEALHSSALNMARLVQDLLELSTASGRKVTRTDVDVTTLAHGVAADQVKGANRPIDVRVQPNMRAQADASLLRVVFTNLIGNAVKFTRSAQHPRIDVGILATENGRAFFVRDNGVGFDPTRSDELFEPFARLHAASDFEGSGIGLATVKRIVVRHGGTIWADSKPQQGATFYFTIPEAG